jgi:hypothetical protein
VTTITYLGSNNVTYVRVQPKSTILARLCRRTAADKKRSRAMAKGNNKIVYEERRERRRGEGDEVSGMYVDDNHPLIN